MIILVLTAIMVIPDCRKRDQTAASEQAYPVTIEAFEGLKTVRNPEFPKEGVVRYALQEELTIGGESGEAESVLNRPKYLNLDSQGNIYVMDWGDVDIKVFDPRKESRITFLMSFHRMESTSGRSSCPGHWTSSVETKPTASYGRRMNSS